ncbi:MAG: MBL fold metallo-hydrolase [Spirochaetales bacterium]|nr:MBL fold metallo-hydrolase [Spirochaetales bacterium]
MLKDCGSGFFLLPGNKSSNIYFIQQKDAIIIDTGHPHQAAENLNCLKEFGIAKNDVKYIINTHSHPDHVGGNIEFLNYFSDAQIINSKKTKPYIKKKKSYALYEDIEDAAECYPIHIEVTDTEELKLGSRTFKIIETPGHTADSVSIACEEEELLFSGDTLYQNIIPQVDYYNDLPFSLGQLRDSYGKLKAKKYKKIFPGHGSPFENSDKVFAALHRKIEKFTENPQFLLINTICPLIELYLKKNPGKTIQQIVSIFGEYLNRPVSANLWPTFKNADFRDSVEKALILMKAMNILTINGSDEFFLAGELNEHL